jgi:hypothetical protein
MSANLLLTKQEADMSHIIRVAFIVLCAYAGSVAGGAQSAGMAGAYQSASD